MEFLLARSEIEVVAAEVIEAGAAGFELQTPLGLPAKHPYMSRLCEDR